MWDSYGPAGELSPRVSPGFAVCVTDELDQLRETRVLPDFDSDAR